MTERQIKNLKVGSYVWIRFMLNADEVAKIVFKDSCGIELKCFDGMKLDMHDDRVTFIKKVAR